MGPVRCLCYSAPSKQEIVAEWQKKFAPAVPPELEQALAGDPALLELTQELAAQTRGRG